MGDARRTGHGPTEVAAHPHDLRHLSTRELVMEAARKASLLARKEVELARNEVKADIKAEVMAASGLGVAGVCAIITITLLLVALALGLMEAEVMRGWLATLLIAAVVLAIGTVAGLVGWARRVRQPLVATRKTLKEDVEWAKERIA